MSVIQLPPIRRLLRPDPGFVMIDAGSEDLTSVEKEEFLSHVEVSPKDKRRIWWAVRKGDGI